MSTTIPSRYAQAHLKPKGPGDARPTALQIIQDERRQDDLSDKVVFITGCSSGIGVETARAMKATGATLFVTARNLDKARLVLGDLLNDRRVHLLKLDLESFDSVRACAADFHVKSGGKLNILIENAGIRNVPFGKTKDGFELHWGTNHLSHFLLFELLKPALLASSTPEFQSRVVIVSSTAHRNAPMDFSDLNWQKRKYDGLLAYGQSKLANVYTASEIERRYGSQGLHAWSAHPGGIRTGLQKPSLADYAIVWKSGIMATLNYRANVEQGASTSVWAAVSRDLEGKGGKYLEQNQVSKPVQKGFKPTDPGHEEWAYDVEKAKRLYDESLSLVGLGEIVDAACVNSSADRQIIPSTLGNQNVLLTQCSFIAGFRPDLVNAQACVGFNGTDFLAQDCAIPNIDFVSFTAGGELRSGRSGACQSGHDGLAQVTVDTTRKGCARFRSTGRVRLVFIYDRT